MVSPSLASGPVPAISSLVSSFVGAGPDGGVTVGSFDRGPLVGVLPDAGGVVGLVAVLLSPALISELSAVFSLPTVIVLEPPEPQPAITNAARSAAGPRGGGG